MDYFKLTATGTLMIAFSTFLSVLFGGIYYVYQIKEIGFTGVFFFIVIYLNINSLFLLILKRLIKSKRL